MRRGHLKLVGTALVMFLVVSCAGDDGDGETEVDPVTELLSRLPASEYDAIVADGDEVEILFGDLARTAEVAELAAPSPGRQPFEAETWAYQLTGRDREQRSPLAAQLPLFPVDVWSDPGATATETGIDVGAVETFVSLAAPPRGITVLTGDVSVDDDLPEVSDGVRSAGTGADFARDVANPTELRIVGRSLRLGETDDAVAYSFSTPAMEEWLAGADTVLDRGAYPAVAAALDRAGVVNGAIFEHDFSRAAATEPASGTLDRVSLVPDPFDIVGMGVTLDLDAENERIITTVVYAFPEASGAAASVDAIEALWTETVWEDTEFRAGLAIRDLFVLESIEQDDAVVTVTMTDRTQSSLRVLASLVPTDPPMFVHD